MAKTKEIKDLSSPLDKKQQLFNTQSPKMTQHEKCLKTLREEATRSHNDCIQNNTTIDHHDLEWDIEYQEREKPFLYVGDIIQYYPVHTVVGSTPIRTSTILEIDPKNSPILTVCNCDIMANSMQIKRVLFFL